MLGVFDAVPKFCPNCGEAINLGREGGQDYHAGCSFECGKCKTFHYQRVPRDGILSVADDLKMYADRGWY